VRGRLALLPALTIVTALIAATVAIQVYRDRHYRTDQTAEQILYIQSPEFMKRLVLSYDALAADLYWIRALQHFGGPRIRGEKDPKFELLYPLLDMATSLDPYFNLAYRFGSTFLSHGRPTGPGRPDLAIKLLEKGLRTQPQKWQYMQDAGFVHDWANQDYRAAAEWFERASRVPGSPAWLKSLTAVTLVQGGERATSRLIFRALAESAEDKWTRDDAARRLRQLDAMDQLDALRNVVAVYRARGGAVPMTWQSLAAAGYLRGIPADPDGFVYVLGPWSGDVSLDEKSTLLPLPVEKARASSTPPA
jgi:hypothetical protein